MRNGDGVLGMTLHRMTREFDAGPVYAQGSVSRDRRRRPGRGRPGPVRRARGSGPARRAGPARGRRPGDPQDEAQASYAGVFELEYVEVDWTRPARDVHNQTRAWKMSPPVGGRRGPLTQLDGRRVRLVRTSLDGDRGGLPVACGDRPIWVLESEPVPDEG